MRYLRLCRWGFIHIKYLLKFFAAMPLGYGALAPWGAVGRYSAIGAISYSPPPRRRSYMLHSR